MSIAAVFPGQGSQYVGMGSDIIKSRPEYADSLKLADKLNGISIMNLINVGPKEVLDDTRNAQPAIFTVNYLHWRLLKDCGVHPEFVAGHSLGEISACQAAGVFSFADGLKMVVKRAELTAASGNGGGMAAILGLNSREVVDISLAAGLELANYNCRGQVVVSGPIARINDSIEIFKSSGAKKVVKLPVSGAFHSSAMEAAGCSFKEWLKEVEFADPRIPVISNVTARPLLTADEVKSDLAKQIKSAVQWQASVENMIERGVDRFIEVGPGRVLSGLIKRISPNVGIEHAIDWLRHDA